MLRKSIYLAMLTIAIGMMITGCWDSHHSTEPIHGSGKIVKENRNLAECNGINIKSAAEVFLTQSDQQSILVETDDNIIDHVITKREDGILVIALDDNEYSDIKVKVFVSLKSIQRLLINGAGNISVKESIIADNLETVINGAGNVTLKGAGNYLNCILNGAGNIDAEQYAAKKVDVILNGAGNCYVNVSMELNAAVNGIGSIYYFGNPALVKKYVGGVGGIFKK